MIKSDDNVVIEQKHALELSGIMSKTYTLHINAYSPETIPMARLANYMQSFALLLGHESAVHFDKLKPGSTQIACRVDFEDIPKVRDHLEDINRGEAAREYLKAKIVIDRLLAEDNTSGFIYEDGQNTAQILSFPGITRPRPVQFGPFNQEGSLDGILTSIGGTDRTVHLQLQNGDIKYTGIETDRDTARRLGKHIFEPIRIFGIGRWLRDEDGAWNLKRFRVQEFIILANDNLRDVIEELREIEDSDWKNIDDPLVALDELRKDDNGLN